MKGSNNLSRVFVYRCIQGSGAVPFIVVGMAFYIPGRNGSKACVRLIWLNVALLTTPDTNACSGGLR
jgi:hypothetical protein